MVEESVECKWMVETSYWGWICIKLRLTADISARKSFILCAMCISGSWSWLRQVLVFLKQKHYLQCVCFNRLPVWNKLEALFTWSSSTLSHVKTVVSAVWSFCVHKKNCKILCGKCVMQFAMLKELQIYETWVRNVT